MARREFERKSESESGELDSVTTTNFDSFLNTYYEWAVKMRTDLLLLSDFPIKKGRLRTTKPLNSE